MPYPSLPYSPGAAKPAALAPPAPRRHRPLRRRLAIAGLVVGATLGSGAAAADEDAERALLRRSWAEACGHYDELTNWTARQACNLAWFRAHEKDVWQHNLNPHGAATGPSS